MPTSPFRSLIASILDCRSFGVVGVSHDTTKYGYLVYAALREAGYAVVAVNPKLDSVDGDPVYPRLDALPSMPECVVTVVPPKVTENVVRDAARLGARYVWMQPGSESEAAVNAALAAGLQVVYGGPCIMLAVKTAPRKG